MPETGVLQKLAGQLHGDDAGQTRTAAWEVLRLAERLAELMSTAARPTLLSTQPPL